MWNAYYATGGGAPADASVPPATAYAAAVLALSPTAYWRLGDASGNATDSSGNTHHLTAGGTPTYGAAGWASDGNGAIAFDADWFSASNASWMNPGLSDWSLSWVMKHSGTPSARRQILGHQGTGDAGEWGVQLETLSYRLILRADAAYSLDFSGTVYDDAFHHFVVACDRSASATVYIDGSSAGTVDISSGVALDLTNSTSLFMGARSTSPSYPFVGTLDEVVFWNGYLVTSADAATLYGAR